VSLADAVIPPSLGAKQALRLRRFGLAALVYLLGMGLVGLLAVFGLLAKTAALQTVAASVAVNLALYLAFRSGLNLRFADPSLTLPQMVIATTVLMFVIYHMDDERSIALFGCFLIFLFGTFRLRAREFVLVTLFTLAAYALVIVLLTQWRPQAVHNLWLDWVSLLVLTGALPCFLLVGGQISALRRALHESETRFRALTEMSSDFYWESDAEHRLTERGGAARKSSTVSVFRQGAQIGKRRWEVPYLSPDEAGWRAHRADLDAHRPFRDFELSRLGTDGTERFISISGDPVFDASGRFTGYRGVGSDVTARRRAEEALRESAKELRQFTDNVPVMTVSYDQNLLCRFVNKRFAEYFGLTVEAALGMHLREIVGEAAYAEIEGHFARVLEGKPTTYQRVRKLPDGESRHLEVKLLPHTDERGQTLGCFCVTTDITEHKLAELRIQRVAHHDSLTGLPNRLLFNDRLAQSIRIARRDSRGFALLFLDLDKFKEVNDTLGHDAGDELLQEVAAAIRGELRDSDTVARVGGDEFTVILPDIVHAEDAGIVASKIVSAFSTPVRLKRRGRDVQTAISIGIALFPSDARDSDALVSAADAAMYRAKQAGCGYRYCAGREPSPGATA
jgi:diguanylate cyclase (GGDEF)-like protein/PAS domain S-box-containing protein